MDIENKPRTRDLLDSMCSLRRRCFREINDMQLACIHTESLLRELIIKMDTELVKSYYDIWHFSSSHGELRNFAFSTHEYTAVCMHRMTSEEHKYWMCWKCYWITGTDNMTPSPEAFNCIDVINIGGPDFSDVLYKLFRQLICPDKVPPEDVHLIEFSSLWAKLIEVYPSAESIRRENSGFWGVYPKKEG